MADPAALAWDRCWNISASGGIAVRDRLESWLPDPEEDERWDLVRDWARAARTFHGYTAEGRRFARVLETDAIITFKGEVHIATVFEGW